MKILFRIGIGLWTGLCFSASVSKLINAVPFSLNWSVPYLSQSKSCLFFHNHLKCHLLCEAFSNSHFPALFLAVSQNELKNLYLESPFTEIFPSFTVEAPKAQRSEIICKRFHVVRSSKAWLETQFSWALVLSIHFPVIAAFLPRGWKSFSWSWKWA